MINSPKFLYDETTTKKDDRMDGAQELQCFHDQMLCQFGIDASSILW